LIQRVWRNDFVQKTGRCSRFHPASCKQRGDRQPDADPEDLLLVDDFLGINEPGVEPPNIDPDARRRRLSALINAATLARTQPALFIIDDIHWIDEVSESVLADFFTVVPRSVSLVLITYRPE
jgi:adenylate cyclase